MRKKTRRGWLLCCAIVLLADIQPTVEKVLTAGLKRERERRGGERIRARARDGAGLVDDGSLHIQQLGKRIRTDQKKNKKIRNGILFSYEIFFFSPVIRNTLRASLYHLA
jgi:hypothetical protein